MTVASVEKEGTEKSQQVVGEQDFTAKQAEAFALNVMSRQWTLNKDECAKLEFAAGKVPRDANAMMKECLEVAMPSWELNR